MYTKKKYHDQKSGNPHIPERNTYFLFWKVLVLWFWWNWWWWWWWQWWWWNLQELALSCNPIKIHVTYLPMLSAHNPHKTHPQIDSKALRTILTNLQKNFLSKKILLQIKFVSSPTTQSSKYKKKIILSRCIFFAPCHVTG